MVAIRNSAWPSPFRVVVACIVMLVCLPAAADSEAMAGEQGYTKLALIVPEMAFRLDYHRIKSDGTVTTKFQDESTSRSEGIVPWLSVGVRVWDRLWVGGDYLSFNGESDGKIGKKVRLGPFSFFVNAPTTDTYKFDIGRVWVGYRVLESETGNLMALGGMTVIQARAKAVVPGLVQESVDGILPLPMLGLRLSHAGPYSTRWLLEADYSYVNYNDIDGRATNISASVEKPLAKRFLVGAGYKHYEVSAKTNRTNYDAKVIQKLTGPFLFINYAF